MTENCCMKPYSNVDCTTPVDWGVNETLTCFTKNSCQHCVLAMGFTSSGCIRCCAVHHATCDRTTETESTFSIWAILVLATMGSCFVFTLLYVITSRRRNDNAFAQATAPYSYFVSLPVATVDIANKDDVNETREPNEHDEEDVSISESIVLVDKPGSDDNTAVPVARRTVPPVMAVRRPVAHTRQANMFYLDVSSSPSTWSKYVNRHIHISRSL
jgi:hypothetical protein